MIRIKESIKWGAWVKKSKVVASGSQRSAESGKNFKSRNPNPEDVRAMVNAVRRFPGESKNKNRNL